MLIVISLHGADDADVVHTISKIWEKVADRCAALAARAEFPARLEQNSLLIGKSAAKAHRFSVGRKEFRFRVERVHVRHAAIRKDEDDLLRFRRKMGDFRRERVRGVGLGEKLRNQAWQDQ